MAINNDPELRLSNDMKKLIDAVVDHYGDCTGVQLSALTHKKDRHGKKHTPVQDEGRFRFQTM